MNLNDFSPIPNFEAYLINRQGQIYSTHSKKLLSLKTDKDGYLNITLSKNSHLSYFRVHRLVALVFLPNPENLPVINHKNNVPHDNRVENLEWCTISHNSSHWWQFSPNRTSNSAKSIIVYHNNELIGEFDSIAKASKHLGIEGNRLYDYLYGKTKSIKGIDIAHYKFEVSHKEKL